MQHLAGLGIFFPDVRIQKEKDARPRAVQRLGMPPVVLIDRPEIENALEIRAMGLAEKWKNARCRFAFTPREDGNGPRHLPFAIFFFTIIDEIEKKYREWEVPWPIAI